MGAARGAKGTHWRLRSLPGRPRRRGAGAQAEHPGLRRRAQPPDPRGVRAGRGQYQQSLPLREEEAQVLQEARRRDRAASASRDLPGDIAARRRHQAEAQDVGDRLR
eukprot:131721-Pyramimonas_sp.AAC.1